MQQLINTCILLQYPCVTSLHPISCLEACIHVNILQSCSTYLNASAHLRSRICDNSLQHLHSDNSRVSWYPGASFSSWLLSRQLSTLTGSNALWNAPIVTSKESSRPSYHALRLSPAYTTLLHEFPISCSVFASALSC
jgi:hypothetical protein